MSTAMHNIIKGPNTGLGSLRAGSLLPSRSLDEHPDLPTQPKLLSTSQQAMQFKRSFFFCMLALSGIASSLPIAPGSHPNSDFKIGSLVYRRGRESSPPVTINVYDPDNKLVTTTAPHRGGKEGKQKRKEKAKPYQRPRPSSGGKPAAGGSAAAVMEAEKMVADLNKLKV
ncbi:hypothetical protein D9611_006453 [Ephemerocybe angulata]|uniref:Uncharacterized protein n=1 Tax=Ephemerocybe angulata TaxID=980116 RepID=A0A8H5FGR4_9AGAR|nr:hypothetical protein D9611_006453 [Tulosesus angulatus]